MEAYQLYNLVISFMETLDSVLRAKDPNAKPIFPSLAAFLWTGLAIALAVWAALFILQGFGLYYMAKKQKMAKKYLAFIPFANILYMSKLAGQCTFFGRKMKHAGVYAMIAQILCTVVCSMVVASQMYLYIVCAANMKTVTETVGGVEIVTSIYWSGLTGFSRAVDVFYYYSSYILSIFELVYEVLMLVVVIALLRKYTPRNYFILSFVVLFVPISRYIIIFVLKNKTPIDYEAYMRKKREAYIRQQQQYNPYGMPLNGPYSGPYGYPQNNGQPQQNPQNEQNSAPGDPFEEFSSGGGNTNGQNADAPTNTENGSGEDKEEFFN